MFVLEYIGTKSNVVQVVRVVCVLFLLIYLLVFAGIIFACDFCESHQHDGINLTEEVDWSDSKTVFASSSVEGLKEEDVYVLNNEQLRKKKEMIQIKKKSPQHLCEAFAHFNPIIGFHSSLQSFTEVQTQCIAQGTAGTQPGDTTRKQCPTCGEVARLVPRHQY